MNRFYKNMVGCFIVVCFVMPIGSVFAKTKYVVGVQNFEEYLPYSGYNKKAKEYKGFNRILLDMFAKSNGYTFIYKALPINRLYKDFLSSKVDFKYPDNKYWSAGMKKGKNVQYSNPVVSYIDGVLVRSDRMGKGVENLKLLGIVRGFTPFAYLKPIKAGKIKLHENDNIAGLLKQTSNKRVDGAYFNVAVAQYYLRKMGDSINIEFDSSLPHSKSTRHISTINYPKVILEFNAFLKANKSKVSALKTKFKVEERIAGY